MALCDTRRHRRRAAGSGRSRTCRRGAVVGPTATSARAPSSKKVPSLGDRVVIKNGVVGVGARDARERRLRRSARRVHERSRPAGRRVPDAAREVAAHARARGRLHRRQRDDRVRNGHRAARARRRGHRRDPRRSRLRVVVGNPAHAVGWICECGNRLRGAGTCAACGRHSTRSATASCCADRSAFPAHRYLSRRRSSITRT